jgi:5-methylcytosine-specific restriction protein A
MPDYRSPEAKVYRALYKTRAWQVLRLEQLRKDPLCSMCAQIGRVVAANVVDHVNAHKGDHAAFYDPTNLQSLCKLCHDSDKQQQERIGYSSRIGVDGWPVHDQHPANGGKQKTREGLGAFSHPAWFRPVFVPLTIVCGAPASGKTTYVEQHKGDRDIVFDLDTIALRSFGRRVMSLDKERMLSCLRIRNEGLADLMWAKAKDTYDHAWLIVSEPMAHKRQWWTDTLKPAEIVVLETPADQCIARARDDKNQVRESDIDTAIRRWWANYTRRNGDTVVTP